MKQFYTSARSRLSPSEFESLIRIIGRVNSGDLPVQDAIVIANSIFQDKHQDLLRAFYKFLPSDNCDNIRDAIGARSV